MYISNKDIKEDRETLKGPGVKESNHLAVLVTSVTNSI